MIHEAELIARDVFAVDRKRTDELLVKTCIHKIRQSCDDEHDDGADYNERQAGALALLAFSGLFFLGSEVKSDLGDLILLA